MRLNYDSAIHPVRAPANIICLAAALWLDSHSRSILVLHTCSTKFLRSETHCIRVPDMFGFPRHLLPSSSQWKEVKPFTLLCLCLDKQWPSLQEVTSLHPPPTVASVFVETTPSPPPVSAFVFAAHGHVLLATSPFSMNFSISCCRPFSAMIFVNGFRIHSSCSPLPHRHISATRREHLQKQYRYIQEAYRSIIT